MIEENNQPINLHDRVEQRNAADAECLAEWLEEIGKPRYEVARLLMEHCENPHKAINTVFLFYLKKTVERLDLPIECDLPEDADYEDIQKLMELVISCIKSKPSNDECEGLRKFIKVATILTPYGQEERDSVIQQLSQALQKKTTGEMPPYLRI
ncbi:hypothetical protein ACFL6I_11380 [candidate division KSB1 bacterium]